MLAMLKCTIWYIDSAVQTLVSLVPTHIQKENLIPIKQPLPSPLSSQAVQLQSTFSPLDF